MKTFNEWQLNEDEFREQMRVNEVLKIIKKYREDISQMKVGTPPHSMPVGDVEHMLNYIENTLMGARDKFLGKY
jgi:hypothetical protein